ncbi:MAG: hypothetical protein FWH43_01155 [Endomicrobia bacterium]|nr:hypothetical protein [Endomicrobiia bacterium]
MLLLSKLKNISFAAYAFIFLFAFVLYLPALNFGLSHLDDIKLVRQLSSVYDEPNSIAFAFFNDVFYGTDAHLAYYRPMLSVSFILDHKIVKALNPVFSVSPDAFSHFTNVILHCVCSVLVFFFFGRYLLGFRFSFIAALLFAAHPIALQTVAWIPGRNDSILLMFFIPCFAFFIEYLNTKNWYFLFFHGLFLMFCLGTKETAVVIVPLLWIYYILNRNPDSKLSACAYAAWGIILGVFFFIKSAVVPGQFINMLYVEGSKAFVQNALGFLDLLSAIVFFRAPAAEHIETKVIILGIISALIILFSTFWKTDKKTIRQNICFMAGILAFFAPNFVVMRFFFQGNRIYVGFFFVLAIVFSFAERLKNKQKNAAVIIAAALIILSSYITRKHEYIYEDDMSMWTAVAAEAPKIKLLPLLFYADMLIRRNDFDTAMPLLTGLAEQTNYTNVSILFRIERVYERQGDAEKVLQIQGLINKELQSRQ